MSSLASLPSSSIVFLAGGGNSISAAAFLHPIGNAGKSCVNTKSKYWKPGSRYFSKTKQGEYTSEREAVQKGYRPANGTRRMNMAVNHNQQTEFQPLWTFYRQPKYAKRRGIY